MSNRKREFNPLSEKGKKDKNEKKYTKGRETREKET
jgi:hypothetical protein